MRHGKLRGLVRVVQLRSIGGHLWLQLRRLLPRGANAVSAPLTATVASSTAIAAASITTTSSSAAAALAAPSPAALTTATMHSAAIAGGTPSFATSVALATAFLLLQPVRRYDLPILPSHLLMHGACVIWLQLCWLLLPVPR